jgi:hypothetical protein
MPDMTKKSLEALSKGWAFVGESYRCFLCSERFSLKWQIERHMRDHNNRGPE